MTILSDAIAEINSHFPSGVIGTITAAKARESLTYITTTLFNLIESTSLNMVNVRTLGAIADGDPNPLSDTFATLAAAQMVYPFATSLSQGIDYCACKLASNIALGSDGSENGDSFATGFNKQIYIPAGTYVFGNDTWLVRNASGAKFFGDGRRATKLQSNNTVLAFDGLWYSQIEDMELDCLTSSGIVALDIDGNVPGHPYATRSVQGVTIKDVLVSGGGSTYAMALCRLGGSGAQGSECQFINLHLREASEACYYQNGFNALDNNWFGGDVQVYTKHAVKLVAGSIDFHKVSFEGTSGYQQIVNGGWDVDASSAGTSDSIGMYGCRTESLRFYNGSFANLANIVGIHHTPGSLNTWVSGWTVALQTLVKAADVNGKFRAYRVTTAGTTGGTPPTWPVSGTVSDGSVVWTMLTYTAINVGGGEINLRSSNIDETGSIIGTRSTDMMARDVTSNTTSNFDDRIIFVNPVSANVTVTLTDDGNGYGRAITIKRTSTAAHDVIVTGNFGGNGVRGGPVTLPSGTLDAVTMVGYGEWFMFNYTATSTH
jgi:hypothetical protein